MERTITFEELEAEIQKQGSRLVFKESIELNMTKLPNGIKSISVYGDIYSCMLRVLYDNIKIFGLGDIELYNLIKIGDNVEIDSGTGNINFEDLESVGNNFSICGCGYIKLPSLTDIGNNGNFYTSIDYEDDYLAKDYSIHLDSLTTIGNNFNVEAAQGIWTDIWFHGNKIDLTKICLMDGESVHNDVIQFLIKHNICLRISSTSSLVNLALEGVKVKISSSESEES